MHEEIDIVESKTSYTHLKEVTSSLNEPIYILGGWAIFFHASKKFEKAKGMPYLGSRDIDFGFSIGKDMEKSTLTKTNSVLVERMGFVPVNSGLMDEIHTKAETRIRGGMKVTPYFIFPMYVDFFVDFIPKGFKKHFGFDPIHEPLLKEALGGSVFVEGFDGKLLLPTPELLICMKVNSLSNRNKEHLRRKDICDIFVLVKYSSLEMGNINLRNRVPEKTLKRCLKVIKDADFNEAAKKLSHDKTEIKRVITQLLEMNNTN